MAFLLFALGAVCFFLKLVGVHADFSLELLGWLLIAIGLAVGAWPGRRAL